MSKLEELIQQYCPDGVEYLKLSEITKEINIGINPRKFFKLNPENPAGFYVTVRELNGLSGVKQCDKTDLISEEAIRIINERANISKGDVLFSNTGTVGKLALVNEDPKNWGVNEGIYVIKPNNEMIDSRYLYFYLDSGMAYSDYSKKFTGSTLKHVTQEALKSLQVPLPALPVQREIARILGEFSLLSAELAAELAARQKQYNYYRDELFNNVSQKSKVVKLGDLCNVVTKQTGFDYSNTIKDSLLREKKGNMLPYIQTKHFNGKTFNFKTDYYIPVETANRFPKITLNEKSILFSIVGASIGNVGLFPNTETCFLGGAICVAKVKEEYNIDYLYYCIESNIVQKQIKNKTKGAGQATVTVEDIRNFDIPLPDAPEQNRIVKLLEEFDKLTNNALESLPAEIEARQKQYEYYRNKLLSFERKNT